jgi:photosystem II stability/assembly factor-like uncharacterized protein
MAAQLLVGTKKGLFVLHGNDDRSTWELEGPLLTGWQVFHATADPRNGAFHVAANNWVYGATAQRSDDGGKTWERSEGLGLPEDGELKLANSWHIEPGGPNEPDTLWLGGDPGVLFRTDDGGKTWNVNQALLDHETRERWQPGAGGLCCHSIQVASDGTLYIAISAAGAFRSTDGGDSWTPINSSVAADFMPDDKYPEVGQCVHKLLVHNSDPKRLWQQNHCGVYRSDDAGDTWDRLDGNGLPSDFGFGLALDPADPDTAFVVPEESAENRVTCDGRLGVYRTRDGGASWQLLTGGLPQPAWAAVLREAMSFDNRGVYVGTQSGSVFATADGGETWREAATQLPPILSVEAAA